MPKNNNPPNANLQSLVQHPDHQRTIRHEDFIAGIAKGMAILDCFGPDRQRLNTSIAAEKTGMTRAAARRHLLTLQYLGYLQADGAYYYLTSKILKFSGAYLSAAPLPKLCQPLLNLLSSETAHVYSVMVLEGYEAITIARSTSAQHPEPISAYGLHLGNRLPAHATSAGKVLLAALDQKQQKQWLAQYPLKRLTPYSSVDAVQFLALLQQVQQQQWCYSREEHELGVHALAVPLVNAQSQVVAALNIVSPTTRTTQHDLLNAILPRLQHTAQALRHMI